MLNALRQQLLKYNVARWDQYIAHLRRQQSDLAYSIGIFEFQQAQRKQELTCSTPSPITKSPISL